MNAAFAIFPWEHPGADFDSRPHAIVRHDIGGKKRTLWLKVRDGVIFFREPNLVPLYAIAKIFDSAIANDAKELIETWKGEIAANNYGSFFQSHRKWKGTPASANYCIILRANRSGWIKEHFDAQWREFSISTLSINPIWNAKPSFSHFSEIICKAMAPQFLNRVVDAAHFGSVEPRWSGDPDEMLSVWRSAALLWLSPDELKALPLQPMKWRCRSNSAFCAGSVSGHMTYGPNYRLNTIWDVLKWHFGYVGLEWKRASDYPELRDAYNSKVWAESFEKWGEDWRGNWIGVPHETTLSIPPLSPPSQHEKLEAALVLRKFLQGKMPDEKLNALLEG